MRYLILLSALAGILNILLYRNSKLRFSAWCCQLLFILIVFGMRIIDIKRLPGIGMFESLLFFALFLTIVAVKLRDEDRIVIILSVIVTATLGFLPQKLYAIPQVMPALRSPLFALHVPIFFLAYAFLTRDFAKAISGKNPHFSNAVALFGIGILSGGIWAQLAWGSFWSWDPKETWALITWLLLMAGLHSSHLKFRKILAGLAFCAMIFTFIGIAWLFRGLHSYI